VAISLADILKVVYKHLMELGWLSSKGFLGQFSTLITLRLFAKELGFCL